MCQAHRFNTKGGAYEGLTRIRHGHVDWSGAVRLVPENLQLPFQWKKPQRVFVDSMSDLFHPKVPFDFVDRVFGVMDATSRHTYQILTKRPERMAEYVNDPDTPRRVLALPGLHQTNWPLPNVWLGTSVEDQKAADERIPHLLRTPAAIKFLSCEPLLGPVDISPHLNYLLNNGALGSFWIICGGESGPKARPMNVDWARLLRDQCQAAGVAFFFKQHGSWIDDSQTAALGGVRRKFFGREYVRQSKHDNQLLDGEVHRAFPAEARKVVV